MTERVRTVEDLHKALRGMNPDGKLHLSSTIDDNGKAVPVIQVDGKDAFVWTLINGGDGHFVRTGETCLKQPPPQEGFPRKIRSTDCGDKTCPHQRVCANHETAGDFRSESGDTPYIVLEQGQYTCHGPTGGQGCLVERDGVLRVFEWEDY